jgi:glycine dehydrogenase subunit 2
LLSKNSTGYHLDYKLPHTIGRLKGHVGNSGVLVRAYVYARLLGAEGLDDVSSLAVLAANYLWKLLDAEKFPVTHGKGLVRKHEAVVSAKGDLPGTAMKVAKALLDYGMHSPTVYFPLIVKEALMIEPTESEPVEFIEEYAEAMNHIIRQIAEGSLGEVPARTSVGRIDEVKASHPATLKIHW